MDLTQALRGDPSNDELWRAWFVGMYPRVLYTTFRFTNGNKALAEELVQAALLNFIDRNALEKVASDTDAANYLITSAHNLNADQMRLMSARREHTSSDVVEGTYETGVDDEILIAEISEALNQEEKQLLVAIQNENTIQEIADMQGVGYSAAGVRVHRLREKIKKIADSM